MRKFVKIYLFTIAIFIMTLATVITHYQGKILAMSESHKVEVAKLNDEHKEELLKYKSYEYLYNENKTDLAASELKYKSLKTEFDTFKNNIAYEKTNKTLSRGGSTPLTTFEPITVDELNDWIKQKAPQGSPFIGKANTFIKASKETGLDPKYIVAHAALESGWGSSEIAKDKNNFFGIAAYNKSAYSSAKGFSSFQDGIVEGAKWISRNYTEQGQDTLEKMIYGQKAYCVTNSGVPDSRWIYKISSIMIN